MKPNPFSERLKNAGNAPFYQCPQCRTVWLVTGGDRLNPYTCGQCHHRFDLVQARYTRAASTDTADAQLPKAA